MGEGGDQTGGDFTPSHLCLPALAAPVVIGLVDVGDEAVCWDMSSKPRAIHYCKKRARARMLAHWHVAGVHLQDEQIVVGIKHCEHTLPTGTWLTALTGAGEDGAMAERVQTTR